MPKHICYVQTLLACLMVGCNQHTPAPPPVDGNKVAETVGKVFDEAENQRKTIKEDLDRLEVSFLIDGVRNNQLHQELFLNLKALKDAGTKNSSASDRGGQSYYDGDRLFRISPITDIETAADNIDFGRVLAVDSKSRIILIDASAEPVARPQMGWPGSEVIDEYALRRTVNFVAERANERIVKEFGRDNVVLVWTPSVEVRPSTFGNPPEILKKLRDLAPKTAISVWPAYGPQHTHFSRATVAPIEDVETVVKALEGEAILTVDKDRRVILLGDVAVLKP